MDLIHVLNRGVDGRDIFTASGDYVRFIHDMYEFNDMNPVDPNHGRRNRAMMDLRSPSLHRRKLVDIHGWCLMRNHYHMLISEKKTGGLTTFLRKLNIGYAKYFNEKHERAGALFQGRTKKVPLRSEKHSLYILHYIHLNPLDYLSGAQQWRKGRITSAQRALDHLAGYRWSSYLDYAGIKNFPSILTQGLFVSALGKVADATVAYLKDLETEESDLHSLLE